MREKFNSGLNESKASKSTKYAHPMYQLNWRGFNLQPVYVSVTLALKGRIDESAR